jgi:hypothetical protein
MPKNERKGSFCLRLKALTHQFGEKLSWKVRGDLLCAIFTIWYSKFQSLSNTFSKQHEKKIFLKSSFDHLTLVSTAPHLLSITNRSGSKIAFRPYVVLWGLDHSLLSYAPSNFYSELACVCAHKKCEENSKNTWRSMREWINDRHDDRCKDQHDEWRASDEHRWKWI